MLWLYTLAAVGILFVVSIAYVSRESLKLWDQADTWTFSDKLSLPVSQNSNLRIDTKILSNGSLSLEIPYCLLYNAEKLQGTKTALQCSTLPYSSRELLKQFTKFIKLTPDIVITYDSTKDSLPDQFIGKKAIDAQSLESVGSDALPVTIKAIVDYNKPSKNPITLLTHFVLVKKGEKEAYTGSKLASWSVATVKQASDYSKEEKVTIVNTWRDALWEEMNTRFDVASYFGITDTQKFLTAMAPKMQPHNIFCPPLSKAGECILGYENNASTNIIFYNYVALEKDKAKNEKLVAAFRERMIPFVAISNPKLNDYYATCTDAECGEDYHILEQYDYQACPVLELGNKTLSENGKIFLEYRKLKSEEFIDNPLADDLNNKQNVLNLIKLAADDFESSGDQRLFSYDVRLGMDDLCYKFLRDKVTDKEILEGWKDVYLDSLWGKLFIEKRSSTQSFEDSLFEIVLQATEFNAYKTNIIPAPMVTAQRLGTGVQKEDNATDADGYWGSVNISMIMLYLTSNYK